MTANHDHTATRRINCGRCGSHFDCSLGGHCWCADEPYRLRVPDSAAEDCLCPTCLRAKADAQRPHGWHYRN
jgi:hypothetical protein